MPSSEESSRLRIRVYMSLLITKDTLKYHWKTCRNP